MATRERADPAAAAVFASGLSVPAGSSARLQVTVGSISSAIGLELDWHEPDTWPPRA